ncbi:unnamed protein product [Bemisia tabaci]|uniref:Double jelly roll-like domain-containing protein n=1 Tax=Bemisia tabaci TaxID=7038 RepID=A0A9P0F5X4_BEMTA|nr:unnamed protein product [Bemisia tabaci]
MNALLQIHQKPIYDGSITRYQEQTVNPSNPLALSNNDIIHFSLNQSDSLTHLHEGYFFITGKLRKVTPATVAGGAPVDSVAANTNLTNGGVLHLFSRAELKINNLTVESVIDPGLTCIPKIFTTYTDGEAKQLVTMGWTLGSGVTSDTGEFNVRLPFSVLFGLGYDITQVLVNTKLEILLTRARNDDDALHQTVVEEGVYLKLEKVVFKLPHVTVDDKNRLVLLKTIEKDTPLNLTFRSWDHYQIPSLPASLKHSWSIKTSSHTECPRFVIFFLQTGRSGVKTKSSSEFDHCDLRNIKLWLNNESFPQEDLDQNFGTKNYALFYHMYLNLLKSYTGMRDPAPVMTFSEYKNATPLYVIDCSHQKDRPKQGSIDVRLDFEARAPFPPKTTAHCIIVHDTVYEYQALSGVIHKYEG